MTEIIKALEKNEELTSSQISNLTKCSMPSVIQCIKRLSKDKNINLQIRRLSLEEKEKIYGSKIGAKIFIYSISK